MYAQEKPFNCTLVSLVTARTMNYVKLAQWKQDLFSVQLYCSYYAWALCHVAEP